MVSHCVSMYFHTGTKNSGQFSVVPFFGLWSTSAGSTVRLCFGHYFMRHRQLFCWRNLRWVKGNCNSFSNLQHRTLTQLEFLGEIYVAYFFASFFQVCHRVRGIWCNRWQRFSRFLKPLSVDFSSTEWRYGGKVGRIWCKKKNKDT